jgi:ribosomal protein S18 acetylase RimI-like enzyme
VTDRVALRAATPADEPFLRDLLAQVRATEFALLPATLLTQQREAQRRSIAGRPRSREEIATNELGEPLGRLATARDDDGLRIVDVTVDAAHRGAGIGTQLIRIALQRAAEEALPVVLGVAHDNPAARRLYEREGFIEVGRDQIDAFLRHDPPTVS